MNTNDMKSLRGYKGGLCCCPRTKGNELLADRDYDTDWIQVYTRGKRAHALYSAKERP